MRKILLLLLAGSFLVSCNNDKKETKEDSKTSEVMSDSPSVSTDKVVASPTPSPGEEILGSYVGSFGDNKITLLITKASNDSIEGRSIVGGNDRSFKGIFSYHEGVYIAVAKEPGDHKDDGIFTFSMTKANLNQVTGSWKANDNKRPLKEYTLIKKTFEYNPNVGNYPQASLRLLKAKDVENEMKEDLEFMRNEIFARHGYCFERKHLRQQFENEDWYVPNTVDIKGFLTDVEKKNIALIKRYEKYADEYGDEYGR